MIKMLSEPVSLGRGPCTDWPDSGHLSPLELEDNVILNSMDQEEGSLFIQKKRMWQWQKLK